MKALVASGSLICPLVAWTHNITDIIIKKKKTSMYATSNMYMIDV